MKTFSLHKIIFLLVAGLLCIDLSVKAQSALTDQNGSRLDGSLDFISQAGTGNFEVPSDLPENYNGDWIS